MAKSEASVPRVVVVNSTDKRLARDLRSTRLVMVVFHRAECPHSLQLFGLLAACNEELEGNLKVVRCEVESCMRSLAYNKVRVTPTILLVKEGIVADRIEGELTKKELVDRVNKLFQ